MIQRRQGPVSHLLGSVSPVSFPQSPVGSFIIAGAETAHPSITTALNYEFVYSRVTRHSLCACLGRSEFQDLVTGVESPC